MRDRETIDSELRRIALGRRSIRAQGGQPSSERVDELLDERLGHGRARVVADTSSRYEKTHHNAPSARKSMLRRFGPLTALPLSLLAIAAAAVTMFAVRSPHPAAQPATVPPPSAARPSPAAPKTQAPPPGIADRAFIDALKQEGVPIPSHDYVVNHGHAVCDFLAHQPNFAEAVRFVQRSSTWDANQSADFAAGAIVSYCPQYEPASPDEMQPAFQDALSGLQDIQSALQGIEGDLQGIRDGLPALPGHQ
jgi:hypothetical protein